MQQEDIWNCDTGKALRMTGLYGWSCIVVICLISALGLKNVQSLVCCSCTDEGGGDCLPEKAQNVTCSPEYDACVEAVMVVRTSHSSHVLLKKGCGYSSATDGEKAITRNGMSFYILLKVCQTADLCNSNMDLKNYQLAPEDNTTLVPNDLTCYSCIGKPGKECSPSSASVVKCYGSYTHCFDGNVTMSVGNDTTHVPIKGCSRRYRAGVQSITYGTANLEVKGSCCSKPLCNDDLSDDIQQGDMPFLVLLTNDNEEVIPTAAPPQWLKPVDVTEVKSTKDGLTKERPVREASNSNNVPPESLNNVACKHAYLPSLLFFLFLLS